MNMLFLAAFSVLKKILLKLAGEKFLMWLFFWVGEIIVESTKTKRDDKFLDKVKEIVEEE